MLRRPADHLSKDARSRLVRAATAVSRDEWLRAYGDALNIAARRQVFDHCEAVKVAVHGSRGPRIVEARRYSVHVDRLQGDRV